MTIDDINEALLAAWVPRRDIELTELFVRGEPAIGQCAVTALVVQDYLGGEILNTIASLSDQPGITSSHYFNLIDGEEIDLTRQQFADTVVFTEPAPKSEGFPSTREYMLSFPSTVERYESLKQKVEKSLIG